jgi:hypothetical protein
LLRVGGNGLRSLLRLLAAKPRVRFWHLVNFRIGRRLAPWPEIARIPNVRFSKAKPAVLSASERWRIPLRGIMHCGKLPVRVAAQGGSAAFRSGRRTHSLATQYRCFVPRR